LLSTKDQTISFFFKFNYPTEDQTNKKCHFARDLGKLTEHPHSAVLKRTRSPDAQGLFRFNQLKQLR